MMSGRRERGESRYGGSWANKQGFVWAVLTMCLLLDYKVPEEMPFSPGCSVSAVKAASSAVYSCKRHRPKGYFRA